MNKVRKECNANYLVFLPELLHRQSTVKEKAPAAFKLLSILSRRRIIWMYIPLYCAMEVFLFSTTIKTTAVSTSIVQWPHISVSCL